jgi:hypothetical protein
VETEPNDFLHRGRHERDEVEKNHQNASFGGKLGLKF